MPKSKTEKTATEAAAPTREAPARVAVNASGRVGRSMKLIQKAFLDSVPNYSCRFVYDPMTSPDKSQVPSRLADGWRVVDPKEIKDVEYIDISYFIDDRGRVRFSDTILMKIPDTIRAELKAEKQLRANEQVSRIKDRFDAGIDQVQTRGASGMHKLKGRGQVSIKEEVREVDMPQRSSDSN